MEDAASVRGAERLVAFASEDEHLTAPGVRNPRDGDRNGVRRPPITTGPEPPGGRARLPFGGGKPRAWSKEIDDGNEHRSPGEGDFRVEGVRVVGSPYIVGSCDGIASGVCSPRQFLPVRKRMAI